MGKARMVITLVSDYDTTRAAGLKARIAKINGVAFVDFNYTNNKVTLEFDPDRVSPRELEVVVMQENKHSARSVAKPASGVKHASMGKATPRREGEYVCSE
jgi:copper chaperone CopZ